MYSCTGPTRSRCKTPERARPPISRMRGAGWAATRSRKRSKTASYAEARWSCHRARLGGGPRSATSSSSEHVQARRNGSTSPATTSRSGQLRRPLDRMALVPSSIAAPRRVTEPNDTHRVRALAAQLEPLDSLVVPGLHHAVTSRQRASS